VTEMIHDEMRSLYRDMVLLRRLDSEAVALCRQGELGLWAPSLGQEAAQIGAAHAMRRGDFAFPTYREHGVVWHRGVDVIDMMRIFRGLSNGGWDPAKHGVAPYTIVIGDQCPHAVGYAMGIQRDGTDDAVIAFFGDGATSEGDVHEAMVFASVFEAPVVFFCQNNQWAISEPVHRQAVVPIIDRAAGYGMPGVLVDGNDVLAVLAVTREALQRARDGGGPTLIEATTYRMGAHTTSDDPTRYRDSAVTEEWAGRDPIKRLLEQLQAEGAADAEFLAEVEAEAEQLATHIRTEVRAMEKGHPLTMFEHAHGHHHEGSHSERLAFGEYLESFETVESVESVDEDELA